MSVWAFNTHHTVSVQRIFSFIHLNSYVTLTETDGSLFGWFSVCECLFILYICFVSIWFCSSNKKKLFFFVVVRKSLSERTKKQTHLNEVTSSHANQHVWTFVLKRHFVNFNSFVYLECIWKIYIYLNGANISIYIATVIYFRSNYKSNYKMKLLQHGIKSREIDNQFLI